MDDGRRVVVTGVTRGIGRAMARRLADGGHTVAGCGSDGSRVARTSDELGSPHTVDRVDVADRNAVAGWADRLLRELGVPDLVVSNAGRINRPARVWEVPGEELEDVVRVNLLGVAWVLQAFLPAMVAAGRGVIVNMSSGWGRVTSPEVAPYCASKWGVEALTAAVAAEVPSGVAVVSANPGVIDTDMLRTAWGATAAGCPGPDAWAERAVPRLLALGAGDNGRAITLS